MLQLGLQTARLSLAIQILDPKEGPLSEFYYPTLTGFALKELHLPAIAKPNVENFCHSTKFLALMQKNASLMHFDN